MIVSNPKGVGNTMEIELAIMKEFGSNPRFEKRTIEGLASKLPYSKADIEYVLHHSDLFIPCEGCKGDMWTVI